MMRKALWTLWAWKLRRHLTSLAQCRRQEPTAVRHEIGMRLLNLLRDLACRADALPEWRTAARLRHPDELWQWWPSLPILSKEDLRTRFDPNAMRRELGVKGIISATGGSTGEPTPYLHDPGMLLATAATRYFARLQCGWKPGMATVCVWGSQRDIGQSRSRRARLSGWLRGDWLVDGYSLGEDTVGRVLELIERHRPLAIFGFTSMLEFVAREILQRGIVIPPGAVAAAWNGGEMLFPEQADVIQQAFKIPIQNLYGGREMSALAVQSPGAASLAVLRPLVFVEILDERGGPVAPGESGRLVWTSTVCRGTPFVRYDVGDLGCAAAEDCDDAGVRAITQLHGRSAGLMRLPSGRTLNCLFWNHLFKEFQEVRQFQVVIRRDSLLLRLRGSPWTAPREAHIRHTLRGILGDMPVGVDWVDHIPLSPQGKLVQVVREGQS